jgi:hypothetical protein
MRATTALLGGVLALVCVGGCAGRMPVSVGPLEIGGDSGELCIPFVTGRDLTYGFDVIRNGGPVPVVIESVSLQHPQDLEVVDSFLIPVEGRPAIGATAAWPPRNDDAVSVWGTRSQAEGAEISRAEGNVNLVLHLVATSDDAGFDAVRVRYHVGAREFVGSTSTRFRVKPSCIPAGDG